MTSAKKKSMSSSDKTPEKSQSKVKNLTQTHVKIQTAEGWKREMRRKLKESHIK